MNRSPGGHHLSEQSSKGGRFLALSVLMASLVISIVGLFVIISNWEQRKDDPMSVGLLAMVSLLILLIVSLMWSMLWKLRKEKKQEEMAQEGSEVRYP